MGSNQIPLNEFITLQRGFDLPKGDRVPGSVPVIASTGVGGFHNEAKVRAPGVVIGRSGSIGGGQFIQEDFWPLNTALWVKDFKGHHPRFVYYLLRSIDFSIFNVGSGVPTLNRNHLSSVMVNDFGSDHEEFVAKTLGELDDKIQLNRQTNQTLEQMAQALFKSWFVDFDPVIDNALLAGNPIPEPLQARAELRKQQLLQQNPSSETSEAEQKAGVVDGANDTLDATIANAPLSSLGLLKPVSPEQAELRALFPSEFEETDEMGWVPKGWEIGSLLKSVNLVGGGTPKTTNDDFWNGEIPWFSVVDAPNDSDIFVIDTEKHVTQLGIDNSSTKILRAGTTIISARGTVGKCALVAKPMAMNQSCYGVQGLDIFPDEYVYFLIRYRVSDLQQRGHGSVFNTITRDTFESIMSPIPSEQSLKKFTSLVKPYFDKVLINGEQIKELEKLRDTLLPKLISGELRLPEVEAATESLITETSASV